MFKRIVGGVGSGVWAGLALGIAICVFLGKVFAVESPACGRLWSAEFLLHVVEGCTAAGLLAAILGSVFYVAFVRLALGASFVPLFALLGLVAGPFLGIIGRFALLSFTRNVDPSLAHATHDVRWGAAIGIGLGVLYALRLAVAPPDWMRGLED